MAVDGTRRYHSFQIALHWLVVALIISQYITSGAIARTHHAEDPSRIDLLMHSLHNRVGLLIFAVMLVRLGLRAVLGPGINRPGRGTLAEGAAFIAHGAFYVVLLAQAATGAVATYLWWPISAVHRALWLVLLGLIVIHVAAALWHHLVRRNETLARMLPGVRAR